MAKNTILIEKEVDKDLETKIKKNLRKIGNGLQGLADLGYDMYLTPNLLHVCDGETHNGRGCSADRGVVVASLFVEKIDGGDW